MRLSRDAAGGADAGGGGESQVDFALPVRAQLGRHRLALKHRAIPLREIGTSPVSGPKEFAEHSCRVFGGADLCIRQHIFAEGLIEAAMSDACRAIALRLG